MSTIRTAAILGFGGSTPNNCGGSPLSTHRQNLRWADLGLRVSDEARDKLRRALETAGVEFIDENGGGPGVRLKKRLQKKKA